MKQKQVTNPIWHPLMDFIIDLYSAFPKQGSKNRIRMARRIRVAGDHLVSHVRRLNRPYDKPSNLMIYLPRRYLLALDRHLLTARGLGLLELSTFSRLQGKIRHLSHSLAQLQGKVGPLVISTIREGNKTCPTGKAVHYPRRPYSTNQYSPGV